NELLKIKKKIQQIDPNSFIVIHEVKEVVGGKFGFIGNSPHETKAAAK
ncbi:DUF2179 domain-containing protein, partial [Priestia megaterium]